MKRTGIVKAVSKKMKDGVLTGKNAFTLTDAKKPDGTDLWFNGDGFVAEKGDTIEFDVDVNGIWHNFTNVKILAKGGAVEQTSYPNQPIAQGQPAAPTQQVQQGQPMAQQPAQVQQNVPVAPNQTISETNIAFIDLHGKKFKVTLEECN